jgi:hypothetical protein
MAQFRSVRTGYCLASGRDEHHFACAFPIDTLGVNRTTTPVSAPITVAVPYHRRGSHYAGNGPGRLK